MKKKETEKLELLKIQNRLLENEEPQEEAHQERRKFSDSHTLEPYQPEAHNIIQVKRCYIIKNLPYSYMKQDLYRNFSKIGLIERIFFPCHGIAYIYFEGFFETLPALTIELTIGGRRLEAKEKQSIPIPLTTCSIMASGKVSCLSKSDLVKHFSKFGNIVNLKNLPRKSLSNSGCYQFIFIKFSDPSSVLLAIGKIKFND